MSFKNSKKFRFAALFIAVALLVCAYSTVVLGAGKTASAYKPTSEFFVNDFASVIAPAAKQEIQQIGESLYAQTTAQLVVTTVPDLGGDSLEDFSLAMARSWGIGQADKDNGALLLLSVGDRQIRFEVGDGLEGCLPDGKTGRIMDTYMISHLKQDDFSTGLLEGYKAAAAVIFAEYGIDNPDLSGYAEKIEDSGSGMSQIIFFVIAIIVICLIGGIFGKKGGGGGSSSGGNYHDGGYHGGGFYGGGFGGGGFGGGGGGFSGGGGGFSGGGSSRGF